MERIIGKTESIIDSGLVANKVASSLLFIL